MHTTLVLHSTPPSLNRASRSYWKYKWWKEHLQDDLEKTLLATVGRRQFAPVVATASLRFPTRRRRDEGNFRALLEKSLGDAMVNGGWLPDDTPDWFRFGECVFEIEPGPNRTTVILHEQETGEQAS